MKNDNGLDCSSVGEFFYVILSDADSNKNVPYFKGIVSINQPYARDEGYHSFAVLRVDEFNTDGNMHKRPYEMGSYVSVRSDDISLYEPIKEGDAFALYNECQQLQSDFNAIHSNASWHVSGRVYSETPKYYDYDKRRMFPYYDVVDEKEWDITDAKSTQDCEKWLLENHPDYYMGCSIQQRCPSGDFLIMPAPSGEYPEGMFETIENRRKYAAMMSRSYGVDLGPAEFSDKSNRRLPNVDISDESVDIEDTFE